MNPFSSMCSRITFRRLSIKSLLRLRRAKCQVFLSAFLVSSATPQWEIDLIVVHPKSHGKGIGTSLIEEALMSGSNLGVHWAKASIRVDNYASQRAFSKVGFYNGRSSA